MEQDDPEGDITGMFLRGEVEEDVTEGEVIEVPHETAKLFLSRAKLNDLEGGEENL